MTPPPATLVAALPGLGGPVSAALEADLRVSIRRHGVVIWLDLDGHYTAFVDRLMTLRASSHLPHPVGLPHPWGAAPVGPQSRSTLAERQPCLHDSPQLQPSRSDLPYEVHAFRGSHLSLMLALEGLASGTEKVPLLVHLPGFTEETIRQTPFFEIYAAGVRYRKALETLVTEAAAGRVRPEQIEAFKARPDLTLSTADAWLDSLLADPAGGLAAQLRALTPAAILDDLLAGGFVAGRIGVGDDAEALWTCLATRTGLPLSWREATLPSTASRPGDIAFAAAGWALCVEYVDDLKRPPVNAHLAGVVGLPRAVIDECRGLATHLRERHRPFYRRTADETEALLTDEVEAARAEDLGRIDTFRFEEEKVLEAALDALARADWEAAGGWATLRLEAGADTTSFWLREDPTRQSAWQLVGDAARLGQALVRAGARLGVDPAGAGGLEDALGAYVARGSAVDRAHRQLEQDRVALLFPQVPEFDSLRARLDGMRLAWRQWADAWAIDFNAVCRAHGFLPPAALQQRTLFDEVVRPLTQEPGTTACFVVDALRFEMAEELCRQLEGSTATTLHLGSRFAELPTVTEVGMNALAPVAHGGRLTPVLPMDAAGIHGFQSGEFRVADPDSRRRAMHDRVGGGTCPWLTLEEVMSRDGTSLKRAVAQARLVVVHSQEIDHAGEKGVGPSVFVHVIQKLKAAWRLLRDAGVRRFVFTADHGFLLLDDSTPLVQPHGRRVDPKRRHIFSPVAADHTGEARVALADLGYEGATGYLMFPETTAVFDLGRRSTAFVHGGNSLQERVIPVLTVVHRAAAGGSTLRYAVRAKVAEGVGGMHCLEARVETVAQASLDFGNPTSIELALRVPEADGIQVELCQARGKARVADGVVVATVGESFEIFFRLAGLSDARVLVEIHHPGAEADVQPCVPDARFAVTATVVTRRAGSPDGDRTAVTTTVEVSSAGTGWLGQLPEGGVRQVFEHLAAHGTVTEAEAADMLGGQRHLRRFAIRFEEFARQAPFGVRIDVVAGVKRYVREGRG